jgi:hypothetical protein
VTGKGATMRTKKLNVRLPDEYFDMIEQIRVKTEEQDKKKYGSGVGQADVIKAALREYYAGVMNESADNAYVTLIASTMDTVLAPYMNAMTSTMKKMDADICRNIKMDMTMNRKCFDIQFTVGKLTTDKQRLADLFTMKTPYSEVLYSVVQKELSEGSKKGTDNQN